MRSSLAGGNFQVRHEVENINSRLYRLHNSTINLLEMQTLQTSSEKSSSNSSSNPTIISIFQLLWREISISCFPLRRPRAFQRRGRQSLTYFKEQRFMILSSLRRNVQFITHYASPLIGILDTIVFRNQFLEIPFTQQVVVLKLCISPK
jgi:hypothetical protein